MLLLLCALAIGGEQVKDMEITRAIRLTPGGRALVGSWTAGRGRCPGDIKPSLRPAGDGRPCSYHDPSPEIPWSDFARELDRALYQDMDTWVTSCAASAAYCSWLVALPEDEALLAWQQAAWGAW
jgi:hypothetical protein